MRIYLGVLLLVWRVVAVDENEEEYSKLLGSEVWQEIKKSLLQDDKRDGLDDHAPFLNRDEQSPKQSCKRLSKTDVGLIIRTHESVQNGATFLESPTTATNEECLMQCCNNDKCNLAVYEDKAKHSCYLFDCKVPSKCTFTNHTGYVSMQLKQVQSKPNAPAVVEDDLQSLVDVPAEPIFVPTQAKTTTTEKSTTRPVTKPAQFKRPVGLFGTCFPGDVCNDKNAECSDLLGYCICQTGYHNKDGYCVRDCNKFQYECENAEPKPDDTKIAETVELDICELPMVVGVCKAAIPRYWFNIATQECERFNYGGCRGNKNNFNTRDECIAQCIGGQATSSEEEETNEENKPAISPSDSSNIPNEKNINSNINSKNSKEDSSDDEIPSIDSVQLPSNGDVSTASVIDLPHNKSMVHGIIKKKIKKDRLKELAESKGAIIALSLGLGITVLLLLYVGCRLRRVNRRIRRGKPVNSNEADYLINGMYL